MRGFNLYAALVGSLMVVIAAAYVAFLLSQEGKRVDILIEMDKRSKFIPITDIMREQSFTMTSAAFRSAIQRLLSVYVMDLPENESEIENMFRREDASLLLAQYLYGYLRSYRFIRLENIRIELEPNIKDLQKIVNNLNVKVLNGGIVLVYDPSKFRENVPSAMVCQGDMCREVPIFPDERVEVLVPLRLKKAMMIAKDVKKKMISGDIKVDDVLVKVGFCEDYSVCGIFSWDGRMLYPLSDKDVEKVRKGIELPMEVGENDIPAYEPLGFYGGGCYNMGIYLGGKYYGCADPTNLWYMLGWYTETASINLCYDEDGKMIDGTDQEDCVFEVRILPDFERYKEFKKGVIIYENTISLGSLLDSAIGGFLSFLFGVERTGVVRIPGSECKVMGVATCVAPEKKSVIIVVKDRDERFKTLLTEPIFKFRVVLDETPPEREWGGSVDKVIRMIEEGATCDKVKGYLDDICSRKVEQINEFWSSIDGWTRIDSERELWEKINEVVSVELLNIIGESPDIGACTYAPDTQQFNECAAKEKLKALQGWYEERCANGEGDELCGKVGRIINAYYNTNMLLNSCKNKDNICDKEGRFVLSGLFSGGEREKQIKYNILGCMASVYEIIKDYYTPTSTYSYTNEISLSFWKSLICKFVDNCKADGDSTLIKFDNLEEEDKKMVETVLSFLQKGEISSLDEEKQKQLKETLESSTCANPEEGIKVDIGCMVVDTLNIPVYRSTFNYNLFDRLTLGCYFKGGSN